MSETENTAVEEQDEVKSAPNHIAGCSIFIVILLTVIFVISMTFWTYFDYKKAVISITQADEVSTQIANAEDKIATTELERKFGDFSTLVKDKKPAIMELSIDEINLAIAHFEKLKVFSSDLFVTELITSKEHKHDLIVTRASLKMRPGFDDDRYMNGVIKFRPEIAEGSIFPIIEEAEPDTGNPVPEKMMQALSTLMFTEYRNDESIKDVFHRINTAQVVNNKLIITSDPTDQTVAIIDREVTEDREKEVYQLIAIFSFIFASTIGFAIWYRKFRRKQKLQQRG